MSEEKAAEGTTADDEYEDVVEGPGLVGIILVAVNTLAVLGMLGVVVYTQFVFKRQTFTETEERTKLDAQPVTQHAGAEAPPTIEISGITVNIPKTPDPNHLEINPKLHYAELSLVLETHNDEVAGQFDQFKPIFIDKLIQLVSSKKYENLNSVQGRYLLRTEIMELANDTAPSSFVSQVYITNFIIQ